MYSNTSYDGVHQLEWQLNENQFLCFFVGSNLSFQFPGSSEANYSSYTLYLEHLGGFLPLLKGKKISKIRPDFVIYDPQFTGALLSFKLV